MKEEEGSPERDSLPGSAQRESLRCKTIIFIPLSPDDCKPGFDWAACAKQIIRRCPFCLRDSIIGHGWRSKQAHDENHDWIKYHRGSCNLCELTFTFLPAFSLPYTHYSLVTRSEVLRRRFVEHCSWESAAPPLKDPDRLPDSSTLRRWCRSLDSSCPAFSSLRRTLETVEQWLERGEQLECGPMRLSWRTIFPFLQVFWPLRL